MLLKFSSFIECCHSKFTSRDKLWIRAQRTCPGLSTTSHSCCLVWNGREERSNFIQCIFGDRGFLHRRWRSVILFLIFGRLPCLEINQFRLKNAVDSKSWHFRAISNKMAPFSSNTQQNKDYMLIRFNFNKLSRLKRITILDIDLQLNHMFPS